MKPALVRIHDLEVELVKDSQESEEACFYLAKYLSSTRSVPEPNSSTKNSI